MPHQPLYVILMAQSYIKSPGNRTGSREQMFLLNQVVTWCSIQSPCGKWKEIPWSSFCFHWTEKPGVYVCEAMLARQLRAAWPVTFDSPSIWNSTPTTPAAPPPPHPRTDGGVTQLPAAHSHIILRYYSCYLPSCCLSSAGLITTAVHQA